MWSFQHCMSVRAPAPPLQLSSQTKVRVESLTLAPPLAPFPHLALLRGGNFSWNAHRIIQTATRMWWSTAFVSNIYYLFDIKKMFNFWENCILCRGLRMVLVLLLLFPRPNPYDGSMSFLFLLAMCSFVILVFSERRRGTSLSRSRSHSVAHEWHRFQLCDGNGWACTLAPYGYQWYDLTF